MMAYRCTDVRVYRDTAGSHVATPEPKLCKNCGQNTHSKLEHDGQEQSYIHSVN